jgi:hypothetical protein
MLDVAIQGIWNDLDRAEKKKKFDVERIQFFFLSLIVTQP